MTIETIGVGAAPGDNTGDGLRTAMTKINNNFGSSANAASKLVGTATGEIPTADELGVVGETNWASGNLDLYGDVGIGTIALLQNTSGLSILDNQSVGAGDLSHTLFDASSTLIASGKPISGTWKATHGGFSNGAFRAMTRIN